MAVWEVFGRLLCNIVANFGVTLYIHPNPQALKSVCLFITLYIRYKHLFPSVWSPLFETNSSSDGHGPCGSREEELWSKLLKGGGLLRGILGG